MTVLERNETAVSVGIDAAVVADHQVAIRGPGVREDFRTSPMLAGMAKLTERLAPYAGSLVVVEPTAGTWLPLTMAVTEAGCRIGFVQNRDSARLRQAITGRNKTDVIDADMDCGQAEERTPRPGSGGRDRTHALDPRGVTSASLNPAPVHRSGRWRRWSRVRAARGVSFDTSTKPYGMVWSMPSPKADDVGGPLFADVDGARASSAGDRLTRKDYARVGLGLLAESGVRGVTIATACARLGVTKGSFYHHFSSVADLHQGMLDHWEEVYGELRPAALAGLPPLERLDALVDAAVDRNHEVEAAIRGWSRTDERVASAQRRLDDRRIRYVAETLESLGVPAARGRVLAEMGLSLLTGFQARAVTVDRALLRAAVEEWRSVLRGAVEEAAAPPRRRSEAGGDPAA